MKTKKKMLATICVFTLASVLMVMLYACVNTVTDLVTKMSPKQVYTLSAMTSVTMMQKEFAPTASQSAEKDVIRAENYQSGNQKSRPEQVVADMEQVNTYMKMFEGYLVNNGVSETVSAPTEADGEYATYAVKTSMQVPGLDGTKTDYLMYYSEFDSKTDIKIDYDDGEKEEETKVSTTLSGVMIFADTVYPLEGKKDVKTEGKETETEIEFTTRLKDGGNENYITVKQEIEDGEVEYEYTVVRDNKVVSKTKIEIENTTENGETEQEVNLTFVDKGGATPSKTMYRFKREIENGKTTIKIMYNITGQPAGVIHVTADENGNYHYLYDNGYEEDLD